MNFIRASICSLFLIRLALARRAERKSPHTLELKWGDFKIIQFDLLNDNDIALFRWEISMATFSVQ